MDRVGLQVSIVTDEDIGWPEEPTPAAVRADRDRRRRIIRSNYTDEEDDCEDFDDGVEAARNAFSTAARAWATRNAGSEQPARTTDDHEIDNEKVTKVRFTIREGKNRVTMKFEPHL